MADKKIKFPLHVKITKHQLECICAAADDLSSMTGGGDNDYEFIRIVKGIDRFLKTNGFKRMYA